MAGARSAKPRAAYSNESHLQIYVDPEKAPDDLLAFGDFRADLVHVCDGRAPPPDGRLTALGREAICMCLNHIGIVRLVDVLPGEDDDEIPF